jgi:hypothetical protein
MKEVMRVGLAAFVVSTSLLAGCGGNRPAPPPTCDAPCEDGVAIRAIRVGMRLAYNFAVATQPVGKQDVMVPCIPSGNVHITGTAESNAMLGTSQVDLTYTFTDCKNPSVKSTTPERNYDVVMNGVVNERGSLAMGGPTTSLVFMGTGVRVSGTVYDPPQPYPSMDGQADCELLANQDGNTVNGTFCGRKANGFTGF